MVVEASRIWKNLYQGSEPPVGKFVRYAGFDVLVLCAEEYQPEPYRFPGVSVLHVPLNDVPLPLAEEEAQKIRRTGAAIVKHLRLGKRVLVTCHAGLNRSGIVVRA